MAREKEHFRDVVADIVEVTGKRVLGVYDIKKYLKGGHNTAIGYLDGEKTITVFKLASKLIRRRSKNGKKDFNGCGS